MAKCYVRYTGKNPNSLDMAWKDGRLDFLPEAKYSGDRVEEFVSKEEAEKFVAAHNTASPVFEVAEDVIDEHEAEIIRKIVREEMAAMGFKKKTN